VWIFYSGEEPQIAKKSMIKKVVEECYEKEFKQSTVFYLCY